MINFYQLMIITYGGYNNGSLQTGVYRIYGRKPGFKIW